MSYKIDDILTLLCVLVYWLFIRTVLLSLEKKAKKKGRNIQCMACKRRGKDFIPKNCPNRNCKF